MEVTRQIQEQFGEVEVEREFAFANRTPGTHCTHVTVTFHTLHLRLPPHCSISPLSRAAALCDSLQPHSGSRGYFQTLSGHALDRGERRATFLRHTGHSTTSHQLQTKHLHRMYSKGVCLRLLMCLSVARPSTSEWAVVKL